MAAPDASAISTELRESSDRPASDLTRGGGYFPEIDGLRCLAVGGVLLFHLDVASLFGGYLGVDVFFVISGFLIIGAIRKGIGENRFSLADFYRRRFRRLYPALVSTIALTLLAAVAIQLPKELKQTADAAITALFSLSNFHFMVAGGYFEGNAQFRALLHTWSLGVEEQFYLITPIALIGLAKWPRLIGPFVLAVFGLSLSLLIAIVVFGAFEISETTAFYMTPTRMWEFAIGGIVGFFNASPQDRPRVRASCIVVGLCGILFAFVGLNPFAQVAGLDALQPCMCTAALLWAISALTPPRRPVLAAPVLTLVGRASYSIYLVHWPIIVFYKYYTQTSLALSDQLILLAASLALGFAQYSLIEKTFRYPPTPSPRNSGARTYFWAAISGSALVVIIASAGISFSKGLPDRMQTGQIIADGVSKPPLLQCTDLGPKIQRCNVDNRTSARAIALVGDSHAEYILARFAEEASQAGYDTITYIQFGCPAALGVDTSSSSDNCAALRAQHIADLNSRSDIEAVALVSRWTYYESGAAWDRKNNWLLDAEETGFGRSRGPVANHRLLSAGLTRLVESLRPDIEVGVLLPIPQPDFQPKTRAAVRAQFARAISMNFSRTQHDDEARGFLGILSEVSQQTRGRLQVFDPAPLLCTATFCSTADAERVLYRDASHLTDAGAERLKPLFKTAIENLTTE